MERMKTFFKYFLVIVLLIVFSNFVTNSLLKTSYKKIKKYEINVTDLYVDVDEAKATARNGYIKGIVKNNTDNVVSNKYLRFTLLSRYGNILGEKYVKIDKIEKDELKRYDVKFDYDNVKSFRIEMVDTMPEGISYFELIKENVKAYGNKIIK